MDTDPLTDKATLTKRLHETKEDYDAVRKDIEEKYKPTESQWADMHLLDDMYAAFKVAVTDAMRAGYEPSDLMG